MTNPISPQQVKYVPRDINDKIIEEVNEKVEKNWNGTFSKFYVGGYRNKRIYSDIIHIYTHAGWHVRFSDVTNIFEFTKSNQMINTGNNNVTNDK
ncbi:MAG: hypothetical protein GY804_11450 [Alphaproteobacteria bacterium]|nr:hypothetical protein [Alphaproteobacteria bacterium]